MNHGWGSAGDREVIIIIGKSRFGKSTWLGKYLEYKPRKFTFDPFRKAPAEYLNEESLISKHEAGDFKTASSFHVGTSNIADIDLLASVAYLNGNGYFTIEECGVAFYKGERISDPLSECVFLGGHQYLSMVFVAQRAASIPIELRSQGTRVISFLQTEKNDVKWMEEYFGDRFEEVRTLQRFECLDYENNSVSRYFINGSSNNVTDSRSPPDTPNMSRPGDGPLDAQSTKE